MLAVGDMQFQKKCIGRMEEIAGSGRTILFVSHNMATITSLRNRCVLLDSGRITADGAPSEVILTYYSGGSASPAPFDLAASNRRVGDRHAQHLSGNINKMNGRVLQESDIEQPFVISMQYRVIDSMDVKPVPNFHVYRADASCAFVVTAPNVKSVAPGLYVASCIVPPHFLNDAGYFVWLALTSFSKFGHVVNFFKESALSCNVRDPRDSEIDSYGYGVQSLVA